MARFRPTEAIKKIFERVPKSEVEEIVSAPQDVQEKVPTDLEQKEIVELDPATRSWDQAMEADRMTLDQVMEEKGIPFIDHLTNRSEDPDTLAGLINTDIQTIIVEFNSPNNRTVANAINTTINEIRNLSLPVGAGHVEDRQRQEYVQLLPTAQKGDEKAKARLEELVEEIQHIGRLKRKTAIGDKASAEELEDIAKTTGYAKVDSRQSYFMIIQQRGVDLGLLELCYQAKANQTDDSDDFVDPYLFYTEMFSSQGEASRWFKALQENRNAAQLTSLARRMGLKPPSTVQGSSLEQNVLIDSTLVLLALALRLGLTQPLPFHFSESQTAATKSAKPLAIPTSVSNPQNKSLPLRPLPPYVEPLESVVTNRADKTNLNVENNKSSDGQAVG